MATKKVYFFFMSGAKKGRIEAAEVGAPIRIGRQHDCEIQLDPYDDLPASGYHARVLCHGEDLYVVEDLGSTWGTFKNDVRLAGPAELTTGDVIACGLDDQGRAGPKLKFYLEKDVLRCPACEGPVYKKHFRCPGCSRKFCLRCVDLARKLCKPCAGAADPGFEVVDDDAPVPVKSPARVVLTGREAERARRAGLPAPSAIASVRAPRPTKLVAGPGAPGAGARAPRAAGLQPPGDDGDVVAESVDLEAPFCSVCCDFAGGPVFTCPACKKTACLAHRRGVVCPPCAGLPPGAVEAAGAAGGEGAPAGRAAPPTPSREAPPAGRRPTARLVGASSPDDEVIVARPDPGARRPPPADAARASPPAGGARPPSPSPDAWPASPPVAIPPPAAAAPPGGKIDARRPPAIPCERCGVGLSAQDFFVCDRCRGRFCSRHRFPGVEGTCDRCQLQGPPARSGAPSTGAPVAAASPPAGPSAPPRPAVEGPQPPLATAPPLPAMQAPLSTARAPARPPARPSFAPAPPGPPPFAPPPFMQPGGAPRVPQAPGAPPYGAFGGGARAPQAPAPPFGLSGAGAWSPGPGAPLAPRPGDPFVAPPGPQHPPSRPLGPPPARRPQDMVETAADDDEPETVIDLPAPAPSGPLAGVRFECPYCDAPLAPNAPRCGACGREL